MLVRSFDSEAIGHTECSAVVSHQPTTLCKLHFPTLFITVVFCDIQIRPNYSTKNSSCQYLFKKFFYFLRFLSFYLSATHRDTVFAEQCGCISLPYQRSCRKRLSRLLRKRRGDRSENLFERLRWISSQDIMPFSPHNADIITLQPRTTYGRPYNRE